MRQAKINNYILFYVLFNINGLLLKSPAKLQLEKNTNFYTLFDKEMNLKHRVVSGKRVLFFSNGVKSRAMNLAKSYRIETIPFSDGDFVIDVGANWGDLSLYFQHHLSNISLNYLAIEPGLYEYECLISNCKLSNQTIHNIALSSENKEISFFYEAKSANSSIYEPPDWTSIYSVKSLTLNDFIENNIPKNRRIRLLKLEAEGAEYDICLGGGAALSRIDFIAADLGFEKGKEQTSSAPDVINFLLNRNFKIHAVGDSSMIRYLFVNNKIINDVISSQNNSPS